MKNLHLIPTDKPSRLWTNNLRRRLELDEFPEQHPTNIAKHIYITSDEEIKEGDYVFHLGFNRIEKWDNNRNLEIDLRRKVILTTDYELIKDGVQAIDDEFLEWFVKNPSCESVDVNDWLDTNGNIAWGGDKRYQICNHLYDKIIIPQEEPKQEDEIIDISDHDGIGNAVDNLNNEEPKQETLEEAANKIYPNWGYDNETYCDFGELCREKWLEGAKWVQERMYSEEEVGELVYKIMGEYANKKNIFFKGDLINNLFEQFKKK
jgi:hypothetical protein